MINLHSLPFSNYDILFSKSKPREADSFQASLPKEFKTTTFQKVLRVAYDIFSVLFAPLLLTRLALYGIQRLASLAIVPSAYFKEQICPYLDETRNDLLEDTDVQQIKVKTADNILLDGVVIGAQDQTDEGLTFVDFAGNSGYYEVMGNDTAKYPGINQIVRVNYRGAGLSEGSPSHEGLKLDGAAVVEYVHDVLGVPYDKIVVRGWSLGGFVGSYAAAQFPGVRLLNERSFSTMSKEIEVIFGGVMGKIAAFLARAVDWNLDSEKYFNQVLSSKWIAYHPDDGVVPGEASIDQVCGSEIPRIVLNRNRDDSQAAHCRLWESSEIQQFLAYLA